MGVTHPRAARSRSRLNSTNTHTINLLRRPSATNLSDCQAQVSCHFPVIAALTEILNGVEIKGVCVSALPGSELADGHDHVYSHFANSRKSLNAYGRKRKYCK